METVATFSKIRLLLEFKSYYVVWKQNRIKQNGKMRLEFKSYYVVWKLQFADDMPIMHEMRLNRTM